jgi:putative membrane protein
LELTKGEMSVKLLKEYAIQSGALAIIACAVFFFLVPSHASVSSIAGLAIILANFVPLSVATIVMILNIALLVLAFFLCGKEFFLKTTYASIVLPVFLYILERIFPNFTSFTNDPTLDVSCYIFLVSVGLAILFNRNASSGGLDILGKILNKYFHLDIGKSMSLVGMCIALSSAFVYDSKTVVLSVLGTYLNGMVLDHFIFGQSLKRRVCIVSEKEEEVRRFIIEKLHSGATIYEAIGAYKMEVRREIITIVTKSEYQKLINFMKKTDPKAFITIYKVNDIHYIPKK